VPLIIYKFPKKYPVARGDIGQVDRDSSEGSGQGVSIIFVIAMCAAVALSSPRREAGMPMKKYWLSQNRRPGQAQHQQHHVHNRDS
jgi:hypothetical protein